jgi:hypothetical protein
MGNQSGQNPMGLKGNPGSGSGNVNRRQEIMYGNIHDLAAFEKAQNVPNCQ